MIPVEVSPSKGTVAEPAVESRGGLWLELPNGCRTDTSIPKMVLSHEELALLLGGIDLSETRRRKWYRKPLVEESEKSRMPA
jgi:hypothetical protein